MGAMRRTLVLGHRGVRGPVPENTLAAFEAARRAGADGVELDLQLTWDDELVVHHDPDVAGRPLRDLTLDEFRILAPTAPTFAEALEYFASWPEAHLNVELKPGLPPDGREAALARALAAWGGPVRERTWVSSFDPHALGRLARLDTGVPLALLAADEVHLDLLPCLPVTAVHPHHSLAAPGRVAEWRSRGLDVHVWTVNDPAVAAELLDLGVDGLIGDDPAVLVVIAMQRWFVKGLVDVEK